MLFNTSVPHWSERLEGGRETRRTPGALDGQVVVAGAARTECDSEPLEASEFAGMAAGDLDVVSGRVQCPGGELAKAAVADNQQPRARGDLDLFGDPQGRC